MIVFVAALPLTWMPVALRSHCSALAKETLLLTVTPVQPLVSRMPSWLLWSEVLPVIVESVVALR